MERTQGETRFRELLKAKDRSARSHATVASGGKVDNAQGTSETSGRRDWPSKPNPRED